MPDSFHILSIVVLPSDMSSAACACDAEDGSVAVGCRDFWPVEERYQLAAGILFLILLLMIPVLIFRVRKESLARAKAADDLIEAFRALKHGDLQSQLKLEGQDFDIVVSAYNHMVNSLQRLMTQNEARAKANAVSEIRQLEAQFHPHFIFNTLENIKFMVKLNPEAAMKMIVDSSCL